MKKRYITTIVIVVLLLGAAVATVLLTRTNDAPAVVGGVNDPQVTVEGQVIGINHPDGACLTYQIGENLYVSVECPGMAGYEGFTGEYDKDIKVGDRVIVRGNLRTAKGSGHQVYHLAQPGTYMRKAE